MDRGQDSPPLAHFLKEAREGALCSVYRERLADRHTPVSSFEALEGDQCAGLLESVEGGERWGRWSFVVSDPLLRVVGDEGSLWLLEGNKRSSLPGPPLRALQSLIERLDRERLGADPLGPPLQASLVGVLGHDLSRSFSRWGEALPLAAAPNPRVVLPTVSLFLPGLVLAFDNIRHMVRLTRTFRLEPGQDPASSYATALAALDEAERRLEAPTRRRMTRTQRGPAPAGDTATELQGFAPCTSRADYEQAVASAVESIRDGEAIQVVVAQCFEATAQVSAFEVYRQLRVANPSPYLYYLRLPGLPSPASPASTPSTVGTVAAAQGSAQRAGGSWVELAGSSPELLVKRQGDRAVVRPIAGTRPRGKDPAQDQALAAELRADPKERAEHIMLLDLGRNDLGRVSKTGSVKVVARERIERYSQVMHLVSEVEGTLRPEVGLETLLESTFPAGTLSGAPKLRALQLIDALEETGRGLYGGAVGYLDLGGDLDLAICIRTLVQSQGLQWVQAGAGIVEGSVPALEYAETRAKARALFCAVEAAEAARPAAKTGAEPYAAAADRKAGKP